MSVASSDRYSAVSSSSISSTSSSTCYNNSNSYSSSSVFSPLRSATSSLQLSKLINTDYRSMQALKIQQQHKKNREYQTPIAQIPPLIISKKLPSVGKHKQMDFRSKDEGWLSCDELETIEKRFTDLLHEISNRKSSDYQQYEQRAKSCDRLATKEQSDEPMTLTSKFKYFYRKD